MDNSFDINFTFDWSSVLKKDGTEYFFPEKSNLINSKYNCPCIYIWSVFRSEFDDSKIVYIGETENLIKRVTGYINPGPSQQTNIRMNNLFDNYLNEGYKIALRTLIFEEIKLNDISIVYTDLSNNNIRKALEQLFLVIYRKENYTILNKN